MFNAPPHGWSASTDNRAQSLVAAAASRAPSRRQSRPARSESRSGDSTRVAAVHDLHTGFLVKPIEASLRHLVPWRDRGADFGCDSSPRDTQLAQLGQARQRWRSARS